MRIEPDSTAAVRDQASTIGVLDGVLRTAVADAGLGQDELLVAIAAGGNVTPPELNLRAYPGLFATAFEVQARRRRNSPPPGERQRLAERLQQAAASANASVERAHNGSCPAWRVDLAPAEPHLNESLERAKRQIPKKVDRADALAALTVRAWTQEERSVHCSASCLLDTVWPEMLAEVATMVRQVALLEGFGIDGFTDFTSHGAVFVNSARLEPSSGRLPVHVRLAEALVHEATHNRCNAAAVAEPFLTEANGDPASLVQTPLRNDPRPLSGLFQQLVVIVRCSMLYSRLLETPEAGLRGPNAVTGLRGPNAVTGRAEDLGDRLDTFREQGRQALRTLRPHAVSLSAHGRDIVAEAASLLEDEAIFAGRRGG